MRVSFSSGFVQSRSAPNSSLNLTPEEIKNLIDSQTESLTIEEIEAILPFCRAKERLYAKEIPQLERRWANLKRRNK